MRVLIFFYLLPSCYCQGASNFPGLGFLQTTEVRGKISCNHKMFTNVKIWLYDAEVWIKKDKLLYGAVTPNWQTGMFKIIGYQREFSDIEPYIKVQHWCNVKKGQDPIEFCMDVPKKFVYYGVERKKFWNINMDLSQKQKGQRECPRWIEQEYTTKTPRISRNGEVSMVWIRCHDRSSKWYHMGTIRFFPRVSLCDFDARVMGNVQEHTVECVLVINIFNEKIFIFSWFWYLMLLIFTLGSFLYWLFVAIIPYPNRRFNKRHLEICEMPFDPIGDLGTDLVQALWKSFFGIEQQFKRSNSMLDVQKAVNDEPRFWPPPPAPSEDNELRFRRALGQKIDNTMVTQDFLHKLIKPNPQEKPTPRYVVAVSAPLAENEVNEALIRSVDSSPVEVQTQPGTPSKTAAVINRRAQFDR